LIFLPSEVLDAQPLAPLLIGPSDWGAAHPIGVVRSAWASELHSRRIEFERLAKGRPIEERMSSVPTQYHIVRARLRNTPGYWFRSDADTHFGRIIIVINEALDTLGLEQALQHEKNEIKFFHQLSIEKGEVSLTREESLWPHRFAAALDSHSTIPDAYKLGDPVSIDNIYGIHRWALESRLDAELNLLVQEDATRREKIHEGIRRAIKESPFMRHISMHYLLAYEEMIRQFARKLLNDRHTER
jgi:hypothetical protein